MMRWIFPSDNQDQPSQFPGMLRNSPILPPFLFFRKGYFITGFPQAVERSPYINSFILIGVTVFLSILNAINALFFYGMGRDIRVSCIPLAESNSGLFKRTHDRSAGITGTVDRVNSRTATNFDHHS
jgi:hypothetical protein